jgi:hypothetical protein
VTRFFDANRSSARFWFDPSVDVALGQPSVAEGVVVEVANVEVQSGILRLAVLDELEYLRVRNLGGRDGQVVLVVEAAQPEEAGHCDHDHD